MHENELVLKSIKQLMEYSFFIPSYQRGYRWTEKQVEELLEDIWAFAINPPKQEEGKMRPFYCLQPIVVKQKNGIENEWEVIDGQQRLTTIYLILKNLEAQIGKDQKNIKRVYYETREESEIINQIFNELDANNITSSLETIKNNYAGTDWRNRFIQTPMLFNYFGAKRYVRKESNTHGFVLFSGERMSGAHAELYSYSFYLNNLEKKEFPPFASKADYYSAAGDDADERPCAFIDNWEYDSNNYAIDILYSGNQFKLRFFYRKSGNYSTNLVTVLTNQGFRASGKTYTKDVEEKNILGSLNKLCESLLKMVKN